METNRSRMPALAASAAHIADSLMLVQAGPGLHLDGDNELEAQLIILDQHLIPTVTYVQTQLRHRCQRLSCQLLNSYRGRPLIVCPGCAPRKHRITRLRCRSRGGISEHHRQRRSFPT